VLTRHHGRIGLVARGARRQTSSLKTRLIPFQPLTLSWFGKSQLRTLHAAEWQGGGLMLRGHALMCGFYLNELLLRLLPDGDAHEGLFDLYAVTLSALNALNAHPRSNPCCAGLNSICCPNSAMRNRSATSTTTTRCNPQPLQLYAGPWRHRLAARHPRLSGQDAARPGGRRSV
jgi:hypothetical protein